ncbi:phosphotransferase [Streptomyces sp. PLK6-54]|uniref:Phosphotransferase n=1 Tax=Actinacidiphila acidipaludis TaxID=2873382 RepID=A0ABS7Q0Y3_9ACTN|nr:phosphotransferase [Streptomyces acidipaludis]
MVVKARPFEARLAGCAEVQRRLHRSGFPCPELLTDPEPLHCPSELTGQVVTAEALVPGGTVLPPRPEAPELFATALARMTAAAPSTADVPPLVPAPPWNRWDHDDPRPWPWPDDMDVDLNARPGPGWLDETARRVRTRMRRAALPEVVGHGDFESQNIRWNGDRLHVVYDWDSAVARPEAAVAGLAAAVFPAGGPEDRPASVAETERFLSAYARARGRRWTREESEVAWAAGLWVRAFNAKKASVADPHASAPARLAAEAPERLRRADA